MFGRLRDDIDELTLARYRPDDYRLDGQDDSRARGLAGLLRTSLLKRFESSVHAFRFTLRTMIAAYERSSPRLDRDAC